MKQRLSSGFLIVSAFIVMSDVLFILLNYQASMKTLAEDIEGWARQTEDIFRIAVDNKATAMQQLAAYIANDPRVGALFRKGRIAVAAEGGGPGMAGAADARRQLLELVTPSWEKMTEMYDVRQLHFHLGPGSTSFLRVHRPGKYGDNMDTVRYTVVDVNRNKTPTKGFETGRVYSGIRGVVPVYYYAEGLGREYIGALEAGTAFTVLLQPLREELGVHFAILLSGPHVSRNMWPDFIARHFTDALRFNGFFLEAATSEGIPALLSRADVFSLIERRGAALVHGASPMQVCAFTLRDYRGMTDESVPDAGRVVVWQDASQRWATFKQALFNNIAYAVLALVFVESVLYFVWRFSQHRLQRIIDEKTRVIKDNYRRLDDLISTLPIGILVAQDGTDTICDANPMAVAMIGAPPDHIIGQPLGAFLKNDPNAPVDSDIDENDPECDTPAGAQLVTMNGDTVPVLKTEIRGLIHSDAVRIICLSDITRQKEAEEERIAREKLQGVLETAGGVCHELNQPLMAASGFAELLVLTLNGNENAAQKARKISEQIERMGDITRKLMSITRYHTKKYLDGEIIDIDASQTHERANHAESENSGR